MCGIGLAITKTKHNSKYLNNVAHRGPDETISINDNFKDFDMNINFFRLSIIDLDNGKQPFIYENAGRKIYLLCNGEIYNYKCLINKYNLNTESDCRVIMEMYLKNKTIYEIIDELDGEFAFVLIDLDENSNQFNIYFGRDRFGIRPLFYKFDEEGLFISSELKGIKDANGIQVKPRKIYNINMVSKEENVYTYYFIGQPEKLFDMDEILKNINQELTKSVEDRMHTERPFGALLSGGLDSSLICGIASKILLRNDEQLNTFSIGMTEDSPDIIYARKVSKHINSNHHEIIIPVETWIDSLKDVIKQIETYDITTIRASTGQYLISKWIRENTDIKVILNGDGSDELTSGYLYFYNCPNSSMSHNENIILLSEINNYDVLRVDRCISAFGLESRVPFLCHNFVDMYLSIDKSLRNPIKGKRAEKYLLRKAFENDNIIPKDVLFRTKEAFSDGCSSVNKSWFEYIQEYIEPLVRDDEYGGYPSKEAYWYHKIYKEFYPNSNLKVNYWMPKWSTENNNDPSARKLDVYKNES